MTRVLIVDDHALLRDSLRGALEDVGYEVVGEAGDGERAVALTLTTRPDVVLMDVTMPVLDGIEATRRITSKVGDVRVLVLTMHTDAALVARARAAGASGYIVKDTPLDGVVAAVARVAAGRNVMSPGLAPAPVAEPLAPADEGAALSTREEEILQLLADGCAPGEVAKALFISPNTVRNHLASIYGKLGAHDRTQAVVEGLRRGVIRLREAAV